MKQSWSSRKSRGPIYVVVVEEVVEEEMSSRDIFGMLGAVGGDIGKRE